MRKTKETSSQPRACKLGEFLGLLDVRMILHRPHVQLQELGPRPIRWRAELRGDRTEGRVRGMSSSTRVGISGPGSGSDPPRGILTIIFKISDKYSGRIKKTIVLFMMAWLMDFYEKVFRMWIDANTSRYFQLHFIRFPCKTRVVCYSKKRGKYRRFFKFKRKRKYFNKLSLDWARHFIPIAGHDLDLGLTLRRPNYAVWKFQPGKVRSISIPFPPFYAREIIRKESENLSSALPCEYYYITTNISTRSSNTVNC